ncbi:MAG: hypothetical protein H7308_04425 [Chthonomonadaceae bacterium]|nr:hypothetical protein [Chthonomonadaceae bacterium]
MFLLLSSTKAFIVSPMPGWITYVTFGNNYELNIECHWEYRDAAGILLDRWIEKVGERTSFLLWRLVGKTVSNAHYEESSPPILTFTFTDGEMLTVFADYSGYENWSIMDLKPSGFKLIVKGNDFDYFGEIPTK